MLSICFGGYKGRLNNLLFGTLDLYTSHYSSFVSPVTFITPLVIEKSVLETDYDGDGCKDESEDVDDDNDGVEDALDECSAENPSKITVIRTCPAPPLCAHKALDPYGRKSNPTCSGYNLVPFSSASTTA